MPFETTKRVTYALDFSSSLTLLI